MTDPSDGPTIVADRSDNPTVVEYAVQSMFKGKSLKAAAKSTAQKFDGYENMFFGPGISRIDASKLEDALWGRLVDATLLSQSHFKPGMEHFALEATLQHFRQKPTMLKELEKRVTQTRRSR